MTECITKQLILSFVKMRQVTVNFEKGEITFASGLLLMRQADDALGLTGRMSAV